MTEKLRVAVLISGRGSNMAALVDACATPDFPARIVKVIANRADATGLERAKAAGIATQVIDHKAFADRAGFEEALHQALAAAGAELVCLAGFMRVLTGDFVGRWRDRLVNIHPSLLPAFKGLHIHERVIEAGVRITGATVHFVRPETDDGPIIIQAAVAVLPDDDPDTLAARVLRAEHKIYPEALRLIAAGKLRVAGRRVEIEDGRWAGDDLANPEAGSLKPEARKR